MITPRPYLSYSQMSLFEHDKKRYRDVYILGIKMPINRGQGLGKEIAEALESGEETGDPDKDFVISQFPKFEMMDRPIEVILATKGVDVPLLAKPDTCRTDLSEFLEYKTGSGPWNKSKVDSSDQMTFYATVIFLKTKKIPKMELIWAPTEKDEIGNPRLTGEIVRIKTARKTIDLLKMMSRMKNVWAGIAEMCEKELT